MIRFADGSIRYFTILEAKRMQTFPDDYPILGSWTEAMRQLGNAVPVKLGQTIAETLIPRLTAPNMGLAQAGLTNIAEHKFFNLASVQGWADVP